MRMDQMIKRMQNYNVTLSLFEKSGDCGNVVISDMKKMLSTKKKTHSLPESPISVFQFNIWPWADVFQALFNTVFKVLHVVLTIRALKT